MNRPNNWFLTILLASILYSCSSTEGITKSEKPDTMTFPGWYDPSGIVTDSSTIRAYATAIGTDSSDVVKRAAQKSENMLEVYLGNQAEKIRLEMEMNEHPEAGNIDLIHTLRVTNSEWKNQSNLIHSEGLSSGTMFRAFAEVSVSKKGVETQWISALQKSSTFLTGFTGTAAYQNLFSGN